MKLSCIIVSFLPAAILQASVFNDVLSARLDGSEPPASSYVNPFTVPPVAGDRLSSQYLLLYDSRANYVKRAEAASAVDPDQLDAPHLDSLIAWLAHTPPGEGNPFSELAELSLKNDMLVRCLGSAVDREVIGQLMLHVVNDTSQSPLWREYVLQHFVDFYESTWMGAEASYLSGLRNAFQAVLANCLFEDSALCGTSVINLIDLCRSCPEFKSRPVKKAAKAIVKDTGARPESRISALHLLGERGGRRAARIASRVLIEEPRPNTGVQLAAMGALKSLPDWHPEVVANLEAFLAASTHGRLRRLARTLLDR